jgi:DMSO reductase anchor subunit
VLGLATTSVTLLVGGTLEGAPLKARAAALSLMGPLALASAAKLALDAEILVHLGERGLGELKRTALLLVGELARPAAARVIVGVVGVGLVLLIAHAQGLGAGALLFALVVVWCLALSGELLERMLFFRALSVPRMPGAVGP